MANAEYLAILSEGPETWNQWRRDSGIYNLDLAGVDLSGAQLPGVNLDGANLQGSKLDGANLQQAALSNGDLQSASFRHADLGRASFCWSPLRYADLTEANLRAADLRHVDLSWANLSRADLTEATLGSTTLVGLDLAGTKGLDTLGHFLPSPIDVYTLLKLNANEPFPRQFLLALGLPIDLVDFLPSILSQALQYYSCFISYSSRDHEFASRLYQDLKAQQVSAWRDKDDLKTGCKFPEALEGAIRLRDKLVLIFSRDSLKSAWVEKEVRIAMDEEKQRGKPVLFPIQIDDALETCSVEWAGVLKSEVHILDFRDWRDRDAYQKKFELLRQHLGDPIRSRAISDYWTID